MGSPLAVVFANLSKNNSLGQVSHEVSYRSINMTLILHTDLSCQNDPTVGLAHAEVTVHEWAAVAHALKPGRGYLVRLCELLPGNWKRLGNFRPTDYGRSAAQDRADGIITIKISITQDMRLHMIREEYTDDQVHWNRKFVAVKAP